MTTEIDRLEKDVACLNVGALPFTLVSRLGFHCDVWRSMGRLITNETSTQLDFVLKVGKRLCLREQVGVLAKEYRTLRGALGSIIPQSMFVATSINDKPGAIVFAEACNPWFDLADPNNREDALPLLARRPLEMGQLEVFTTAARRWLDDSRIIIDLFGAQNLVLDRNAGVRYLDSFHVFFYLDTLDVIEEVDDGFLYRAEQCVRRLEYLESLLLSARG
jgi:hypothetical protein